ncbi:DUF6973 domain-containing protein [Bacillus sp. NPDC077411]|uniref:DUF6973 domain-containing protein n=1 Tax=Bacillus bruguierae TaxID=3127667 RepID=A0ABU8FGB8_9BACI
MFLSLGAVTNNVYAETNEPSLSEQQIQFEAKQDAFRHAHWNEHMAHRIGQGLAAEFATAHESTSSGNDKVKLPSVGVFFIPHLSSLFLSES